MQDDDRKRIDEHNHALVSALTPGPVFQFFADLAAIPRGSGDVSRVGDYLVRFAHDRNFSCERDDVGNVIIRKPAQGLSSATGVILQAHQDMVCVAVPGAGHDFGRDPIELKIVDEKLFANGTTLGADDGIGVALALAVLDDAVMPHPPLEALFTVDEETDMKGAKAIQASRLTGSILINLDAEDLGVAYVSSAAGVSSKLELPMEMLPADQAGTHFRKILVEGLEGGHSGLEINRGRANGYVLLARFLASMAEKIPFTLHSFEQGEGRMAENAIPDRAQAVVALRSERDAEMLSTLALEWRAVFRNEYRETDKRLDLVVVETDRQNNRPAWRDEDRNRFLDVIRLLPLGVFRFVQSGDLMSRPYGDLLVETSCNLGGVEVIENRAILTLLARGSTASVLDDLTARIQALATLAAGTLRITNRTSGWEMPATPSPVQRLFAEQGLKLQGVHAGLECGGLIDAFRNDGRVLDAISVGPDLKNVHSPTEYLDIESVSTLWTQLTHVLAGIR